MMTENERLQRDLATARQTIRELHEATKDARQARRELEAFVQTLRIELADDVERYVAEGLAHYSEAIKEAIDLATKAVYRRFDKIAGLLLGEDRKHRAAGRASLAEYAAAIAELDEHPS